MLYFLCFHYVSSHYVVVQEIYTDFSSSVRFLIRFLKNIQYFFSSLFLIQPIYLLYMLMVYLCPQKISKFWYFSSYGHSNLLSSKRFCSNIPAAHSNVVYIINFSWYRWNPPFYCPLFFPFHVLALSDAKQVNTFKVICLWSQNVK